MSTSLTERYAISELKSRRVVISFREKPMPNSPTTGSIENQIGSRLDTELMMALSMMLSVNRMPTMIIAIPTAPLTGRQQQRSKHRNSLGTVSLKRYGAL